MKLIEQSWAWEQKPPANPLALIEKAGRTCYKSEDKISPESAQRFVKMLIKNRHETVIEHVTASVRFITNRGISHELVRHRLCSYSQESTRYVRYQDEMEFIVPVWWNQADYPAEAKQLWLTAMEKAENTYLALLKHGNKPEQARDVLPHALKTELVMTANLREWRHVFSIRCAQEAHPQLRALMRNCLQGFSEAVPIIFDDLVENFLK